MSLRGKLAVLGIEAAPGAAIEFPNGISTATDIAVTDDLAVSDDLTVGGLATIGETLGVTGEFTPADKVNRTAQQYTIGVAGAKVGGTSGWTVAAADDISLATVAASETAGTLVVPINIPLKVGWTITAFSVVGQIESAGGTATLDADLRKHTAAAGDVADASVGAITQISVTADTAFDDEKTGLAEVVAADETFYVLLTATTAASTDVALMGVTVTVTEI